jgi:1-acyl-sn-glycerol-3-phosphate acyltransferase/acyl carrier protein
MKNILISSLIAQIILFLIRLRYSITIDGLEEIKKKNQTKGILFLPNHPAVIDPVILGAILYLHFKVRPLVDKEQIKAPVVHFFMEKIRSIEIPDLLVDGKKVLKQVLQGLDTVVQGLKQGDSILFYPAGRVYHCQFERLRGSSGTESIIKKSPGTRLILIRTTGLWGSSFSRVSGKRPNLIRNIKKKIGPILANCIFFTPRRNISISFHEPSDFPFKGSKEEINTYLEKFYNQTSCPAKVIPYFWWQGKKAKPLPEPPLSPVKEPPIQISKALRYSIYEKLKQISKKDCINDFDYLAEDLGMDSLKLLDFALWLENKTSIKIEQPGKLITVSDCLHASVKED